MRRGTGSPRSSRRARCWRGGSRARRLQHCTSDEILDVVRHHGLALARRDGEWAMLRSATEALAAAVEGAEGPHDAVLCPADAFPANRVARFLAEGLRGGQAAIVVLAAALRELVTELAAKTRALEAESTRRSLAETERDRSEASSRAATSHVARLQRVTSALLVARTPADIGNVVVTAMAEAGGVEAVSAPGARVLIVDDNEDAAETLAEVLRCSGHDARTAHHPLDALAIAAEFVPEFAVIDIGLPEVDGWTLGAQLRARLGANAPHCIAVTGYGTDYDRKRSRQAGFIAHLVKPLDIERLTRTIAGLADADPN